MRTVQLRRALALAALAMLATACTSGGLAAKGPTTSDSRPRPTVTTTTLPAVLASATPAGWVPVDYGDAQVSVPADWEIGYDVGCPMAAAPGEIFVGITPSATWCPGGTGSPYVIVSPLVPPSSMLTHAPPEKTINGVEAWGRVGPNGSGYYNVPDLGVQITLHGRQALAVLATLTRSPAIVALAAGPATAVPRSWKWVTGGSVRFAVPASWSTATSNVEGPGCGRQNIVAPKNTVVLDSDAYSGATISCP